MVCLNVCSGAEQRKHQSSASLVFVRGIHRWSANFPHKGPITRKIFHWWRHHGISIESDYTVLTNTHNNTLTTCIIIGHYSDSTGASWWLISTPIRLTHPGKHYIPRYWFFIEWIPCTIPKPRQYLFVVCDLQNRMSEKWTYRNKRFIFWQNQNVFSIYMTSSFRILRKRLR